MFGHDAFYFNTIKNLVVYFGTIFNEVEILRQDSNNNTDYVMKVPMEYSPKEKVLARYDADPEINREAAIILPRMSFNLNGMTMAPNRKRVDYSRVIIKDTTDKNKFLRQYQEVPYDFSFTLWIYSKTVEDGNKILEQILPFFTPSFTSTVNIIPDMGIERDIPINLNGVTYEDRYDGPLADRRTIIWTLDFTLMGSMFGPIVRKPIIKFSNTYFYVGNTSDSVDAVETIAVQPGLDANGDPTSNISITIPAANIDVDDDWGYIVQHISNTANG